MATMASSAPQQAFSRTLDSMSTMGSDVTIEGFSVSGTTTWAQAWDRCSAEGQELCTKAQICRTSSPYTPITNREQFRGASKLPFGGVRDKDSWVAVSDEFNEWIGVGNLMTSQKLCKTYSESSSGKPQWGTDDTLDLAFRSEVLCCSKSNDNFLSTHIFYGRGLNEPKEEQRDASREASVPAASTLVRFCENSDGTGRCCDLSPGRYGNGGSPGHTNNLLTQDPCPPNDQISYIQIPEGCSVHAWSTIRTKEDKLATLRSRTSTDGDFNDNTISDATVTCSEVCVDGENDHDASKCRRSIENYGGFLKTESEYELDTLCCGEPAREVVLMGTKKSMAKVAQATAGPGTYGYRCLPVRPTGVDALSSSVSSVWSSSANRTRQLRRERDAVCKTKCEENGVSWGSGTDEINPGSKSAAECKIACANQVRLQQKNLPRRSFVLSSTSAKTSRHRRFTLIFPAFKLHTAFRSLIFFLLISSVFIHPAHHCRSNFPIFPFSLDAVCMRGPQTMCASVQSSATADSRIVETLQPIILPCALSDLEQAQMYADGRWVHRAKLHAMHGVKTHRTIHVHLGQVAAGLIDLLPRPQILFPLASGCSSQIMLFALVRPTTRALGANLSLPARQCRRWKHVYSGSNPLDGTKINDPEGKYGIFKVTNTDNTKTLYIYDKYGLKTEGCSYCWMTHGITQNTYPWCSTDGDDWVDM